ncbi:MAG: nitroreductase family protein [Candidatus Hodarchaeales archaeon]|jgi:nitroreductase
MKKPKFIPLPDFFEYPISEMKQRVTSYFEDIKRRRTVREFSEKPVPIEIVEMCLKIAGTAPSGANRQPWHFVVISNPEIKKQIREAAENEEREFYHHRAPAEWLEALVPLGTDSNKPFLEKAPCLVAIFSKSYDLRSDGQKIKNYYSQESVGIATGFLITALHIAGLATLTHTPSPMKFLNKILLRPEYERPFLLLVVGYPSENVLVPNISKKSLNEFSSYID